MQNSFVGRELLLAAPVFTSAEMSPYDTLLEQLVFFNSVHSHDLIENTNYAGLAVKVLTWGMDSVSADQVLMCKTEHVLFPHWKKKHLSLHF